MKCNRQLHSGRHHIGIWSRANPCYELFFLPYIPPFESGGPSGTYVQNHPAMRKRRKKCHLRFDGPRQMRDRLWDSFSAFPIREAQKNKESLTLFAINNFSSLKERFEGLQWFSANCDRKRGPMSPTRIPGASNPTQKVLGKTQCFLTKNSPANSPTTRVVSLRFEHFWGPNPSCTRVECVSRLVASWFSLFRCVRGTKSQKNTKVQLAWSS